MSIDPKKRSKLEAWNFTIKTFKTCQFNESKLFICRLKSEHKCSGENARNMHVSWQWRSQPKKLGGSKCLILGE